MSLCSRKYCAERAAPGATRCAAHEAQAHYGRQWAARQRQARLIEQMRTAATCPRKQGPGVCGGRIRVDVGKLGQSILVCEFCERRERGVCRDCSAPVYGARGKAIRCARHKHEAQRARAREAYRTRDEERERRLEYKRAYRKANPDKVRAQKKRYVERHRADPNSKYNRYHASYRKRHRLHRRETENTRNAIKREHRAVPACSDCGKPTGWTPVSAEKPGAPWKTCMKCAWPYQRRKRRRIRREAANRIAADPNFGLPPKPVRVHRPANPAIRASGWERLCVTPGCDIVVTHRKKKCTKCQRRDSELARQQLEPHRGRGRRTDRERRDNLKRSSGAA
jgi:hypothetical protein